MTVPECDAQNRLRFDDVAHASIPDVVGRATRVAPRVAWCAPFFDCAIVGGSLDLRAHQRRLNIPQLLGNNLAHGSSYRIASKLLVGLMVLSRAKLTVHVSSRNSRTPRALARKLWFIWTIHSCGAHRFAIVPSWAASGTQMSLSTPTPAERGTL